MDKRLFLALLLTALVVVVTPLVFPTPRPSGAIADTGAVSGTASQLRTQGAGPVTGDRIPPSGPSTAHRALPDTSRTVTPVVAESVTVAAGGSTYRFVTPGATPISVVLHDFMSLRSDSRAKNVDLVNVGDRLLRYRFVVGVDTLALDTIPMRMSVRAGPRGEQVVAYTSGPLTIAPDVRPTIVLAYTLLPGDDAHLAVVEGRVEGAPLGRVLLLVDLPRTLRTTEADTLEDLRNLSYAFKRGNEEVNSTSFGKLDASIPRVEHGPLAWIAVRNRYFIAVLVGIEPESPFTEFRLSGVLHSQRVIPREGRAIATLLLRDGAFRFQLYAGPQKYTRLHALGRDLENVNPYGGWMHGFVQPFATIVMRILLWIKRTTQFNYGWVLVIFGVLVRLLIWPLNQSAMRSSIRMQRLQPQLQEVQKKYRHDPERQREALLKLYQEHGMNPFAPILGCLPMLLPMPVLFALYFVFRNTIEFRGVPFLWLPDLALKDPYYITPLLMGLSMLLLSWIGMKGAPQTPQTKMIGYMMPAMMTVLFWNFPSGLNLYYGVQNVVALPQQWLLTRERAKVAGSSGATGGATPKTPGKPAKAPKTPGAAKAR